MARRSARLSKAGTPQSPKPTAAAHSPRLGSVFEQDEFADAVEQQQSIDNVINSPAPSLTIHQQLKALSHLKTPKTEPKPTRSEMHPKTVHPTTTAPNSGFKLGFVDLPTNPPTIATAQNTPSRSQQATTKSPGDASFKFAFGSESHLSSEAQKLMDNVREEAARIKAQMQMEKDSQDEKDAEAELMFEGVNATGRKIAKPKSKSGRFSDVHMAQFKKMDSIANHPSSFRGKLGYTQPTTQSLKRSGSKAGLDEPERPRTAGKDTPSRIAPPFGARPASASPFKPAPSTASERMENASPTKRLRRSGAEDVSAARPKDEQLSRPSAIPKSVSTSLLSPTKASLAKSNGSSPNKSFMIPRTQSEKSIRSSSHKPRPSSAGVSKFTSKLIEAQQEARSKPLPPTPTQASTLRVPVSTTAAKSVSIAAATPKQNLFSSKLPTFSGLKSILRSTRKVSASKPSERVGTPKRPNTGNAFIAESSKKVDFTPSVKSRYAVKLAASSPAPAKLPSSEEHPSTSRRGVLYDPAAYVVVDDGDEAREDEPSPVTYPTLPPVPPAHSPGPVVHTFSQKAKDHNRRESKEFKSIFTTLHPGAKASSSTLTSTNTAINQTSPATQPNKVMISPSNPSTTPSASTIRRVRQSGVSEVIQPFEDASVKTMPHGLPGKKRRHESNTADSSKTTMKDARDNRRFSKAPAVPGGWEESIIDNDQENEQPESDSEAEMDEGVKRGAKRARFGGSSRSLSGYEANDEGNLKANVGKTVRRFTDVENEGKPSIRFADVDAKDSPAAGRTGGRKVDVVKGLTNPSAAEGRMKSVARQQAAKNAKERKSGVLSLSRLNVLSRPKQR